MKMDNRWKSLDDLMIEAQTDKATVFSRTYAKPKGYTIHMEGFFGPFRDFPVKFLEIGVGGGESISGWLNYFEGARQVIGIDNVRDTNIWNTVGSTPDTRYTFVYGDQTDETFWKCFAVDYGRDFDIIVDDGSHMNDGTITAFNGLWPLLNNNGLYCIEDLATAYGGDPVFVKNGWPQQINWLREKIDDMNQGRGDVDSIYFSRELAILRKA